MGALFLFGTPLFWIILIAEIILLMVLSESDNDILAIFSLFVFGLVLYFCGNAEQIKDVIQNRPWQLLVLGIVYFAFGTCWSVFKWSKFVRSKIEKAEKHFAEFKDHFEKYTSKKELNETEDERQARFDKEWRESKYKNKFDETLPVLVSRNKMRVIRWIYLWPVSLVVYMFKDSLYEFGMFIFNYIKRYLQSISDNMVSKSELSRYVDNGKK